MERQALEQHRPQFLKGKVADGVHLVDDRFEVFELGKALENMTELGIGNTTIVEEDAIHDPLVEELAGFGQTAAVTFAQAILLKHERLFDHFFEDRQHQVEVFLALKEVVDLWVLRVHNPFALMFHISLRYSVNVLNLLDEPITHRCNQFALFFQAHVEHIPLTRFLYYRIKLHILHCVQFLESKSYSVFFLLFFLFSFSLLLDLFCML